MDLNSNSLDKLQSAIIQNIEKQVPKPDEKHHFDELKLFFGENYEVHGITILQPTIGDILEIGEEKFYSAISPFVNNSTTIRLLLWEMGETNWCKIKDIQVFSLLIQNPDIDFSPLKLLFPDIDFTKFKIVVYEDENSVEKMGLYNNIVDILLTEEEYMEIAEYIRTITSIHPKVEKAKGKTTREWMIQEDKMNALNKKSNNVSSLLPVISTLINHPGFKYKLQELRQVNLCQFYDAVQRVQIYEQTHALLGGAYSGFCDTSKIDREQFNFMRKTE